MQLGEIHHTNYKMRTESTYHWCNITGVKANRVK